MMWRHDHNASWRGSAIVQLVIVLPFLLFILLGALDLGRVVVAKVALASAVHVGVAQGARVIQLKEPESPDWPNAPVWEFEKSNQSIIFDNKNAIIDTMEKVTLADLDEKFKIDKGGKALSFNNKTNIFCRCLRTSTAGTDSYSANLLCDDSGIKTCVPGTGFTKAVRQIYVVMQPQLTVKTLFYWPFVPQDIVISASATMQGDEYLP